MAFVYGSTDAIRDGLHWCPRQRRECVRNALASAVAVVCDGAQRSVVVKTCIAANPHYVPDDAFPSRQTIDTKFARLQSNRLLSLCPTAGRFFTELRTCSTLTGSNVLGDYVSRILRLNGHIVSTR